MVETYSVWRINEDESMDMIVSRLTLETANFNACVLNEQALPSIFFFVR